MSDGAQIQEGLARYKAFCASCDQRVNQWPRPVCGASPNRAGCRDLARADRCPLNRFSGRPFVPVTIRGGSGPWKGGKGAQTWGKLHRWALTQPDSESGPAWLEAFFNSLASCGGCQREGRTYAAENPCPWGAATWKWSCNFHNHINQKLGRDPWSERRARSRWSIIEYLDRAYVISLERTPERLQKFQSEFPTDWPFQTRPMHFPAIDGLKVATKSGWVAGGPAWGLNRSWCAILELCIQQKVEGPVLIMEDDCTFVPGAREWLQSLPDRVPDDADLLFLGGQHFQAPEPVVEGLVRAMETGRTHALIVYPHFLGPLRDFWNRYNNHIDHGLQSIARHHRFYALDPFIAIQAANFSTIRYRQEPSRSWDYRVSVTSRDLRQVPLIYLQAPAAVVSQLRHRGLVHTGYWRNAKDLDWGLIKLLEKEGVAQKLGFQRWLRLVRQEAAAFPRAVVAVWHPGITAEMVQAWTDGLVLSVTASSTEEALSQLGNANEV